MAVYGYGRVSTDNKGQTTDNQKKLIADAGFTVDEFFSENGVSGSVKAFERPAFKEMLKVAHPGDTVIVAAVDRLGRNAVDVLTVVEHFKSRSIRLRVLQFDGIDLTSSTGKLLVTMMAALAEMEKNMLIERTKAGLNRTKDNGTRLGRPLTVEPALLRQAVAIKSQGRTWAEVSAEVGVPKNTLHRMVTEWNDKLDAYDAEWSARKMQYDRSSGNS